MVDNDEDDEDAGEYDDDVDADDNVMNMEA